MREKGLPGWLVPVGLILLVATLVSVALLRGTAQLDPDTPEGTVQEYLMALSEERWDDALAVIHPDIRGDCEADVLARYVEPGFSAQLGTVDGSSFPANPIEEQFGRAGASSLAGTTTFTDTTQVDVTISHPEQGGLGSGWTEQTQFQLVDEDDFWWIVGDPWPYFSWECSNR